MTESTREKLNAMTNPYEAPQERDWDDNEPDTEQSGKKATISLILGCVAILAWCIPIFGLPVTVAGLVYGIQGLGPHRNGKAIAGIVLSVLFLVVTLINAAVGAWMAVNGPHPFEN